MLDISGALTGALASAPAAPAASGEPSAAV